MQPRGLFCHQPRCHPCTTRYVNCSSVPLFLFYRCPLKSILISVPCLQAAAAAHLSNEVAPELEAAGAAAAAAAAAGAAAALRSAAAGATGDGGAPGSGARRAAPQTEAEKRTALLSAVAAAEAGGPRAAKSADGGGGGDDDDYREMQVGYCVPSAPDVGAMCYCCEQAMPMVSLSLLSPLSALSHSLLYLSAAGANARGAAAAAAKNGQGQGQSRRRCQGRRRGL